MRTEGSVATDLGALLRDSIDNGFSAHESSGHMPVQIVTTQEPMSGVQSIAPRMPTPGEFKIVPAPSSTARPVVLDHAPVSTITPTAPKKKSGVVGLVLGAIALASVLGGGGAFYMHKHRAAPVVVAASAPQAAVDSVPPPAAKESAPAPIADDEVAVAPVVERAAAPVEEAKAEEPAKAEAAPKKRAHRTTAKVETVAPKTEKPVASQPVVKVEAPAPKKAEAPKAEAPKPEAPKPAPKPAAGGAVDAVLQQQLSGAIP